MKMSSFTALVLLIFSWPIASSAAAQPVASPPSACQRTTEADIVATTSRSFSIGLVQACPAA